MACAIKICGMTTADDARKVSGAGVDYLGVLVNVTQSPRSVTIEQASAIIAASTVPVIVLTCDHSLEDVRKMVQTLHPAGIQLAGGESDVYVAALRDTIDIELWKSVHLPTRNASNDAAGRVAAQINRLARAGIDRIVLDTAVNRGDVQMRGGTGKTCDWSLATRIKRMVDIFLFLAGGICPGNVRDALLKVAPDGIDLSSGVEKAVGMKDELLVAKVISAVRRLRDHAP